MNGSEAGKRDYSRDDYLVRLWSPRDLSVTVAVNVCLRVSCVPRGDRFTTPATHSALRPLSAALGVRAVRARGAREARPWSEVRDAEKSERRNAKSCKFESDDGIPEISPRVRRECDTGVTARGVGNCSRAFR